MSDVIKDANVTDEKVVVGSFKSSTRTRESAQKVENVEGMAKEKAEEILENAQQRAMQILEETKSSSEKIKKESEALGYKRGLENAQEEVGSLISHMKEIVDSLENQIDSSVEEIKISLIDLAVVAVKEIVLEEVKNGDIGKKINKALEMVKSSKRIVIKLPNDLPEEVTKKLSEIDKVQILPDSKLASMDVQIEANFGSLDLRVNSQLELLEHIIRKSFGDNR